MAAHLQGAVGNAEVELVASALVHRRGRRHVLGLKRDPLVHIEPVRAGFVRNPPIAVEAGIEVDMPLDEGRHQQRTTDIDRVGHACWRAGSRNRRDPSAGNADVAERAIHQPGIGKKRFGCCHRVSRLCLGQPHIRMLRLVKHRLRLGLLDNPAKIHHGNPVRHMANGRKVLADEEVGEAEPF